MTEVKDIYMGEDLRDLEKFYIIPQDSNTKKISILLSTATKLRKGAEEAFLDGDQELSYIKYMRYFKLINCIRNMPSYKENKKEARKALGSNKDLQNEMEKLGILNNSLRKRYQSLADKKRIITLKSPLDLNLCNDINADDVLKNMFSSISISCEELYRQISSTTTTLIMDCRPLVDFQNSRLHYQWCLNVPEENIKPGMSAGKVQESLDNAFKPLWSSRSVKQWVVLMDWNSSASSGTNVSNLKPIFILKDILEQWDPDVNYKSRLKILDKGYEFFILMYPTLCTNPSIQAPYSPHEEMAIEEIEYPTIHDITMKGSDSENDSGEKRGLRPLIDRSSKIAAIKIYAKKHKPVDDILKEREILAEKVADNEKQLVIAENELEIIASSPKSEIREDDEVLKKQQELYFNILQLQHVQEDLILENNRLKQELEESRRQSKEEQVEKVSEKEVQIIEEAAKKIDDTIQQQKSLQSHRYSDRLLKFEKDWAKIREEQKNYQQPSFDFEEATPKYTVPQFDRSVKPTTSYVEPVRDFSPVPGALGRGLTGLRNLGNTCYMNSIIQCLSNTQPFTEYCINDKYKDSISRSSPTGGHIIEEVAALIKALWSGNYESVSCQNLRNVLGKYKNIFRGVEQQDSHEFLTILIDWLHSDLQTLFVNKVPSEMMAASERSWLQFTHSRESLILRLFYGQIKSTVKCVDCNKESATYEIFSNLSLELPMTESICHLQQCLDMYFNGERIYGWICPNCNGPRDAIKKLDISKLPPVLVVHFKRFANVGGFNSKYKKKTTYVKFPLENLDMTPYIAKSELRSMAPKTYQLYGISNHYGSTEAGHYTAFCKNSVYGRWFKFDDRTVLPIDISNVISSAAYILFYTWLPQVPPPEF